jgi:hypothetical protein
MSVTLTKIRTERERWRKGIGNEEMEEGRDRKIHVRDHGQGFQGANGDCESDHDHGVHVCDCDRESGHAHERQNERENVSENDP